MIAGSRDLSTPPDDGRYLADRIPGARYVELPAPHLSNVEAAPAFTQALLQFLTAPQGVTTMDEQNATTAAWSYGAPCWATRTSTGRWPSATSSTTDFQELITRYAWGEIWSRPELSRHTRSLLTIAMMVALNRRDEFRLHLRAAFNNGVTRDEIKEVLLHCAIYAGVPAANSAYHMAEEVFAQMHPPPE